ncbi:hypothetical protein LQF12_03595 [Ruania suaedae]|uniref:hypothetical protein n=1 Tax=Ruania suaedae TaxID=2897774 RepID=UPI001E346CC9|nr:hypothetical protein [Ruania suaedae]UFU03703.1 hypothetical protein LQF12_03595 [Ruania suaedae]
MSLVVSVVLVLAAGVGVNALDERTSPSGSVSTPFSLGEDVEVGNYRVHVHGARAAQTLEDDGELLTTAGRWVIVDLSYAAVRSPEYSASMGLRDSQGRMYTVSNRSPVSGWPVAPDTWMRGEVAFEVASDSVGEMTLFVWPFRRSLSEDAPVGYATTRVTVEDVASEESAVLAEPELLEAGER